MKILALLAVAISVFGCEIAWQNSLDSAKKLSSSSKKPIMVFVASQTCPYCTMMLETTFEDESVCKEINKNFIPLVAMDGGAQVPKNVRINGVPTTVFVNSAEKEVAQKIIGLRYKNEFLQELKNRNF